MLNVSVKIKHKKLDAVQKNTLARKNIFSLKGQTGYVR